MDSAKTWILLANHDDASLMRNKLAFDLGARPACHVTDSSWVDLRMNDQYRGNYLHHREGGGQADPGRADQPPGGARGARQQRRPGRRTTTTHYGERHRLHAEGLRVRRS